MKMTGRPWTRIGGSLSNNLQFNDIDKYYLNLRFSKINIIHLIRNAYIFSLIFNDIVQT